VALLKSVTQGKEEVMTGETNLTRLIASMSPNLLNENYVFVTVPYANEALMQQIRHDAVMPMASFTEKEGYSFVFTQVHADKLHIKYEGVFACITLNVHSSLEAVGLTAAIASCLTEHNISANVIAAYFHDHVFVARKDAQSALEALHKLSKKAAV
jgi:hypothetical protein